MDIIWWFTAAAGGIAINLIASELFTWGPRLSEWLMRRAVRRLLPEMQERMQEEWAGHLQTIPPGLWRIVAAAGFYLATRQINVALLVRERQENARTSTLHQAAGLKAQLRQLAHENTQEALIREKAAFDKNIVEIRRRLAAITSPGDRWRPKVASVTGPTGPYVDRSWRPKVANVTGPTGPVGGSSRGSEFPKGPTGAAG